MITFTFWSLYTDAYCGMGEFPLSERLAVVQAYCDRHGYAAEIESVRP